MEVEGNTMKNTKLFIILSGMMALLLGVAAKNQSALQAKLANHIKVDTQKYLIASECSGDPTKPPTDQKKVA